MSTSWFVLQVLCSYQQATQWWCALNGYLTNICTSRISTLQTTWLLPPSPFPAPRLPDPLQKYEYFWLVDPVDGTKEFLKRNGEFTVNIALVYRNEPVMGVVHVPVSGKTYC